jgi:hypothetical protein
MFKDVNTKVYIISEKTRHSNMHISGRMYCSNLLLFMIIPVSENFINLFK